MLHTEEQARDDHSSREGVLPIQGSVTCTLVLFQHSKSRCAPRSRSLLFFLFLFFSSVSQVELGKQMVALGSAGTAHIPGIVNEFQFTPFRQVHYTDMSDYPTRSTLHSLFQNLRQKEDK